MLSLANYRLPGSGGQGEGEGRSTKKYFTPSQVQRPTLLFLPVAVAFRPIGLSEPEPGLYMWWPGLSQIISLSKSEVRGGAGGDCVCCPFLPI